MTGFRLGAKRRSRRPAASAASRAASVSPSAMASRRAFLTASRPYRSRRFRVSGAESRESIEGGLPPTACLLPPAVFGLTPVYYRAMPWEADLQSLEASIVRLNAEYDAFLYGSAARPPVETRKLVEKSIRRLNALEPESAADRYRFNTLQGRYNALCERWDRLQNEKELGKRPGVYGGGFARESRRVGTAHAGAGGPALPNAGAVSSVEKGSPKDRDA